MGDETAPWDRYWRFDRIASCMDGCGKSNYDERIAGPWRDFFAALAPTQVLDICTGNGAVALIAAAAGMAVTGIDLADIDPARFVSQLSTVLGTIRFIGRTNASKLPFADGEFGAVVSQYGIEYAPRPQAWQEAARVTAPGGQLRMVVHAADGNIAAETRAALEDADFLLDDAQLTERARQCVQAVHLVETMRTTSAAVRASGDEAYAAFQSALNAVADRLPTAVDAHMLENTGSVLADAFAKRRQVPLAVLVAKIDEIELEIVSHRERQRALVAASMGPEELALAAGILSDSGMVDIVTRPLEARGRLLAHVIEARRPA